jgi:hypothetical protein
VNRGGSILATFETSLYDPHGTRRKDFGLADLFGVSFDGTIARDVKNSYIRIEPQPGHPILRGIENAGRVINTVQRVGVKPTADFADPPLTQVPSYPDLPMEEVYPRTPSTRTPEVFLRAVGKGRVVYFPGDIDRTFWEVLAADHGTILRNAVQWALNEPRPVEVTGPGVLDVTAWRQRDSMTVHLVNLTNPMMMKGPFRELLPVGPQTVRVRLPAGRGAKAVLLVAGTEINPVFDGKRLSLVVPSVLDHEVIAITF